MRKSFGALREPGQAFRCPQSVFAALRIALKRRIPLADIRRVAETSENKIILSNSDTELLKKALEEAAEQASVPPAGGTTQYVRKKPEIAPKGAGASPSPKGKLI